MYRCGCRCANDRELRDEVSDPEEYNEPDLRMDIRCECRSCGPRRRGCARRCRVMCDRVLLLPTFQAVGEMIVLCGECREGWCPKRRRYHCKAKAKGKAKGNARNKARAKGKRHREDCGDENEGGGDLNYSGGQHPVVAIPSRQLTTVADAAILGNFFQF